MTSHHAKTASMISLDFLRIPEGYIGKPKKVDNELLRNSIKLTGVQQPLIVMQISESDFLVVDGVRRFQVAQSLGIKELPCVIDHGVEDVDDETEYRNRIRFILDEHRQDLLPTQRATLIKKLQENFGLTHRQVGHYLGVTSGTITNWTLIEKMILPIQKAIDDGHLRVHTARAFAGMTAEGQQEIWDKEQGAIAKMSGSRLHRWVRQTYSPTECPQMYESPETAIKHLTRKNQPRKSRKRTTVSVDEKRTLLKDVDAKRIELSDKKMQLSEFEEHINAAIPIIDAIRRNKAVLDMLPKVVRDDFKEFADRLI